MSRNGKGREILNGDFLVHKTTPCEPGALHLRKRHDRYMHTLASASDVEKHGNGEEDTREEMLGGGRVRRSPIN
jgi:hypothetical protein